MIEIENRSYVWIVACHHVAVTDLITETVARFVGIRRPFALDELFCFHSLFGGHFHWFICSYWRF